MGGSKSSQTQQTTNTSVQQSYSDNSRTDIYQDNRQTTDIYSDQSIRNDGTLSGAVVGGNVTITDGGAFGLAGDALRGMEFTALSAFDMAEAINYDSLQFGRSAIESSHDLASDFGGYLTSTAKESIWANSDLAMALGDNITRVSRDAQNTVLDTTKMALQFADASTRSDGQQLAISTNKNMMMMVGVMGAVVVAVFVWGKK